YSPAVLQQYALNLRGGSQNISWLLSGGYDHNISDLSATLRRISLRSENTIRFSAALQLTAGLSYSSNNSVSGQNDYGSLTSGNGTSLYPYAQLADDNGNPLPLNKGYRQAYLDTVGQGKLLDWKYYPLEDYKHSLSTENRNDWMAFANLNYQFSKDWKAELQYRYENQGNITEILSDKESFFTRNLINNFTQLNYTTGDKTYKIPVGGILDQTNTSMQAMNYRAQFQYNRSWKKHRLSGLIGAEIREVNTNSNTYRTYGYNPDNLTHGNVDYTSTYPQLVTGFSSFIPNNNFFSSLSNRYVSTYANLVYTYLDKYTFSASGRRDASNIFGVNTNQKWNPLWSAGFSWNLSNEKFYNLSWLPYCKLNLSYGYSGNIDPNQSAVTTIMYQSTSPYTRSPMATISKYGNPDLRWEKSGQLNIRLEFKTTRNRLGGTIEYYSKTGKDLYGLTPIDYTGVISSTLVKNTASMKGSGWDIEVNSLNMDGKFKWQTTLLWNTAQNTVTDYYTNTARASAYILGSGVYSLSPLQGYPVYSVFSYPFAGLDPQTGNPQGILNHQLSTNYTALISDSLQNAVYNGSAVPVSQVAVRNTFSIGRFSLAVNIIGKFGYYFRRSTIDYLNLFNNGSGHADFANRWQNPGDELITTVPSMVYPLVSNRDVFYKGSEPLVEKGDHIRLQYITLSYEYTPRRRTLSPFKHVRVFVNASNLGILWRANSEKLDPDYLDNTIPPSASFSAGCNLSF
ncbi:MAG: TonB-dependent receptor, partial [Bacteroidota bacterium]|nr:TonB-dependent receptor [Bacteroidota bacterium]